MSAPVLVVFSGTHFHRPQFETALQLAREEDRPLLLLDVRHEQQADRLEDYLESESPLGRATVKALKQSVKLQRDRCIGGALEAMAETARQAGIAVSVRQEKGDFEAAVLGAARDVGAATVVVPEGRSHSELAREFKTLQA